VLDLTADVHDRMVALAYDGYPLEACGLLGGDLATGRVSVFYPCVNTTRSARIYAIDPKEHLRAELDAEGRGLEIVGVMHSHTHTEAYPSPTDVAQAPDPSWHYVIVSLKREAPVLRSFRIVDGLIVEERVTSVQS
jgi:[CysO sulfur-carrier protein]-S-L-cysteine hydrolase